LLLVNFRYDLALIVGRVAGTPTVLIAIALIVEHVVHGWRAAALVPGRERS
jgi:hypothetical protein